MTDGPMDKAWPTLVDLLQYRAQESNYIPYAVLKDGEDDERTITAGEV